MSEQGRESVDTREWDAPASEPDTGVAGNHATTAYKPLAIIVLFVVALATACGGGGAGGLAKEIGYGYGYNEGYDDGWYSNNFDHDSADSFMYDLGGMDDIEDGHKDCKDEDPARNNDYGYRLGYIACLNGISINTLEDMKNAFEDGYEDGFSDGNKDDTESGGFPGKSFGESYKG